MPTTPNDATRKLLAQMWQKNQPLLRERLAQLDAAANALVSGTLPIEARREAANTAHKLAGSLGMFGYPRGTDLARELEVLLDGNDAGDRTAERLMQELRTELGME